MTHRAAAGVPVDPVDARVDPAAAVGFDRAAADYERARPGYPARIVEILEQDFELGSGATVCDLAAGTGKLTRLLVGRGWNVVAVEPVPGMRAKLAEAVPVAAVLDGIAESIRLPDRSMDAVTVAQAFHWFDSDRALTEILRVLRPGGGLAIVFNRRDEREPWVAAMSRIITWHQRTAARYQSIDWAGLLGGVGFGPVDHAATEWSQPITRELLASRVRSISYIAASSAAEQQRYVSEVLALVDGLDEPFDLPYVTDVWWARSWRS